MEKIMDLETIAPPCLPKQTQSSPKYDYNLERPFKIVIIDDQYSNTTLIKLKIQQAFGEAVKVTVYGNPVEVLETIDLTDPEALVRICDFMILDYMMPLMDGISYMYKLEDNNIIIPPFIICTANRYMNSKQLKEYFYPYLQDVLTKPVDFELMNSIINTIISEYE
jgi:CheY-like chemotaxis protein